jgi:nitrilase
MIVDPWGVVLDRLPRGAGVVMAAVDRAHLARIRNNFPAVRHRRTNLHPPRTGSVG